MSSEGNLGDDLTPPRPPSIWRTSPQGLPDAHVIVQSMIPKSTARVRATQCEGPKTASRPLLVLESRVDLATLINTTRRTLRCLQTPQGPGHGNKKRFPKKDFKVLLAAAMRWSWTLLTRVNVVQLHRCRSLHQIQIINSSQLRAAGFRLDKAIPPQLESAEGSGMRTRGAGLCQPRGIIRESERFVLNVDLDTEF